LFPGEAALVLIWATLEQDRLMWRGVQMDADLRLRIVEAAATANRRFSIGTYSDSRYALAASIDPIPRSRSSFTSRSWSV
jgi:hypothetical protein